MPVGTKGTVKGLTPQDLRGAGAGVVLGNTYHLYLRPGADLVREAGGLHGFSGWEGPMLTDSGGFQVFSLAKTRRISENGVRFASVYDGSIHEFTPELTTRIQEDLGADIVMVLDECPPANVGREYHAAYEVHRHGAGHQRPEVPDNAAYLYEGRRTRREDRFRGGSRRPARSTGSVLVRTERTAGRRPDPRRPSRCPAVVARSSS